MEYLSIPHPFSSQSPDCLADQLGGEDGKREEHGKEELTREERCGAEEGFASLTAADETLLRAIGLRTEREGGLSGRIAGMFDGHCDGHKETDSD